MIRRLERWAIRRRLRRTAAYFIHSRCECGAFCARAKDAPIPVHCICGRPIQ